MPRPLAKQDMDSMTLRGCQDPDCKDDQSCVGETTLWINSTCHEGFSLDAQNLPGKLRFICKCGEIIAEVQTEKDFHRENWHGHCSDHVRPRYTFGTGIMEFQCCKPNCKELVGTVKLASSGEERLN